MGEVIRVSGRAPDVGEFLREAMLSRRFADVALCCPGGQRFLAHRLVLSAASPYLQEVLLAHGKAAGHCEPITVILAEMESPELAAILGLVYTGSAAVPRHRLDAFLRAAQALHIQLPPLPEMMTSHVEDCKLRDIEDAKMIGDEYLKYPHYERLTCARERSFGKVESPDGNVDSYWPNPNESLEHTEIGQQEPRAYRDPANRSKVRLRPSRLSLSPFLQYQRSYSLNGAKEKFERSVEIDRDRESPTKNSVDFPKINGADLTIEDHLQMILKTNERLPCLPVKLYTSLPRLPEACDRSQATSINVPSCPIDKPKREFSRSSLTAISPAKSCEVGYEIHDKMADGPYEPRIPSIPHANAVERQDCVQNGEDLSCRDSCCRWKQPKRHVANRVTASPWRQLSRPHHSPKIQPIVLQSHLDPCEVSGKRSLSAETLPPASASSKDQSSRLCEGHCQVPTSSETKLPRGEVEAPMADDERRLHEFYRAQIVFPSHQLVEGSFGNSNVGPSASQVLPSNENVHSQQQPARATSYGQPGTKLELSHPVSRLCDTFKSSRDVNGFATSPETRKPEEKVPPPRVPIQSDSNNNDASASESANHNNNDNHHHRTAGNPEEHRCDQCGKAFVTRASLKVHARTHSGEKPFRCSDCGKQFSQLRNYKYHRSVHEGTREFAATCPECGKYFNDRGYLSSHMKIHRNRKEYACAECGKSFNQRVAYNMHVRIHTGVKPHQCEQCGKAFSRKMLLKQHLRTHSGERPYQCQVCHKAFADRSNMTLHTRLHSGLKPYQCTLCSKAFTKKHHLKTHLNYHTGTKPYSCPNCGLRFSQSSNMRTHYKKCSVNNPNGLIQAGTNDRVDPRPTDSDGSGSLLQVVPTTPSAALTPPNSDQESSILTPIPRNLRPDGNKT